MTFKRYDSLRLFVEIAKYSTHSDAAAALNMTKGAVSYQIKMLEADLGASLFVRSPKGMILTQQGREILSICRSGFDLIEAGISDLSAKVSTDLTVGMSTYFASRWLSPKLMSFMQEHPKIRLRIQPMTHMFELERQGIDLAIRWGDGRWNDVSVKLSIPYPAWPVGNRDAKTYIEDHGMSPAFSRFTLLRDHDGSRAWTDWLRAAGLHTQSREDTLIIPDPNVRVRAVIDGQGVALYDGLVAEEIKEGRLFQLSEIPLPHYGYHLVLPNGVTHTSAVESFVDWIKKAAQVDEV